MKFRLVEGVPRVYVGPAARRALAGERGILLGAKRPRWVDVLEFESQRGVRVNALVEERFASFAPWDVVGLSLSWSDFRKWREPLLRGLVPGDILVTERGTSVHVGDAWTEAKMLAK